jgi:hypothetical protein
MNRQPLFDSVLYQSKEVFDIAAVSRLYGCNKIPAIELVQELLDDGLLSRHWRRPPKGPACWVFCKRTKDNALIVSDWNSRRFYKGIEAFQQSTPTWY